jgi:TRAP-type C4-dicarboxylate transport system permease small subunit
MGIVSSDVLMRYGLNRPWQWSHDVITLYLTPCIFYLALPRSFVGNAQIRVDILQSRLPLRVRLALEGLSCLASAAFFLAIGVVTAGRAWEQFISGDTVPGIVDWPAWLSVAFVPLGCLLLASRLVIAAAGHAISLLTGLQVFDLPPITGSAEENVLEPTVPKLRP